MPGKKPAVLEINSAKQLIKNSKYVDQQYRNQSTGQSIPREFPSVVMMKTTSSLARMSNATPGTGEGKIQKYQDGVYSDLTTLTYQMVNPTTTLIASGAYCLCCLSYGYFHVLTVDSCSKVTQ